MQRMTKALAMGALIAPCAAAMAADGTITFNGQVNATTCNIAVDSTSAADATVTLPTVSAASLAEATRTAGITPFNIRLSGCDATGGGQTTAFTYFEQGPTVDAATGRLVNSGTASNVQIELLRADQQPIVVGSTEQRTANTTVTDVSDGSGDLQYYARYYATGAASAGGVSSSVNYTIAYR